MASVTPAQLIRIARLRQFVGVFARGGDREAAAEALLELSRLAQAGGLRVDALRRARQAAELLADEAASEAGVRSLLRLASSCLDVGHAETAAYAGENAHEPAGLLAEPARAELLGAAALLAGVARALAGEVEPARALLDEARERLIASRHPEGAALAIVQLGLLDVEAGRWEHARICFRFARELYLASRRALEAAEVAAVAARALAARDHPDSDGWFRDAIDGADRADAHELAAELLVERAAHLERAGAPAAQVAALATEGALRCARAADAVTARRVLLRARMLLGRVADSPREAVRHIEAAFEHALDLRDPEALGSMMELLVTGLVDRRLAAADWQLVVRFRQRLADAGFAALSETAELAIAELYDDGAGVE